MRTFITTDIDRSDLMKGDVVIVKRTYVDPKKPAGQQLVTVCTECGGLFPTTFRRMGRIGTPRALEVRNVPQCPECRSRYAAEKRAAKKVEAAPPLKAGDLVTCDLLDSPHPYMPDECRNPVRVEGK